MTPVDDGSPSPLPLRGRTVVVTRARDQAGGLARLLEQVGATVLTLPTIEIVEPVGGDEALRRAAAGVEGFDWVALSSPNAARRFVRSLPDRGALAGVRIAAVGPGTAGALASLGVAAHLVAPRSRAEGLVEVFPPGPGTVLVPQAEAARAALVDGLRARGWDVTAVVAYRTVPVAVTPEDGARARRADAIAFTSASTVAHFLDAAGADALPPVVVCIGPLTAAAAVDRGVDVTVVAEEHTLDGLLAAVVGALA